MTDKMRRRQAHDLNLYVDRNKSIGLAIYQSDASDHSCVTSWRWQLTSLYERPNLTFNRCVPEILTPIEFPAGCAGAVLVSAYDRCFVATAPSVGWLAM